MEKEKVKKLLSCLTNPRNYYLSGAYNFLAKQNEQHFFIRKEKLGKSLT